MGKGVALARSQALSFSFKQQVMLDPDVTTSRLIGVETPALLLHVFTLVYTVNFLKQMVTTILLN